MSDYPAIKVNSDALEALTLVITDAICETVDDMRGDIGTVVMASLIATGMVGALLAAQRQSKKGISIADTREQMINAFKCGFAEQNITNAKAHSH